MRGFCSRLFLGGRHEGRGDACVNCDLGSWDAWVLSGLGAVPLLGCLPWVLSLGALLSTWLFVSSVQLQRVVKNLSVFPLVCIDSSLSFGFDDELSLVQLMDR